EADEGFGLRAAAACIDVEREEQLWLQHRALLGETDAPAADHHGARASRLPAASHAIRVGGEQRAEERLLSVLARARRWTQLAADHVGELVPGLEDETGGPRFDSDIEIRAGAVAALEGFEGVQPVQ